MCNGSLITLVSVSGCLLLRERKRIEQHVLPAKSLAAQRYVKLQATQQARGCFHTKSEMSLINHKFKWQMLLLEFQP